MYRKFFTYFFIFFVASFAILNSRFVSAQLKFTFFEREKLAEAERLPVIEKDKNEVAINVLPIVKSDKYSLEIPSLGISAPVILELSGNPEKIFSRLEEGVVHYAGTPLPGETGTSIILGHSSAYPWYRGNYGSVFALLGYLKAGDKIVINNGGRILTYQVKESLVFYPFSKDKRLEQLEQTGNSSIILVSCWPVGTNYKRIAIKADLI